jgi:hypothetical protein
MVKLAESGLAFTMPTEVGHLVGIVTHAIPRLGSLVWIAEATFPTPPTAEDVAKIDSWRWPIFFLAATAVRRKLAARVGMVPVPPRLRAFPMLRGGASGMGWVAFTYVDGEERIFGRTTDRSLPVNHMVNPIALREMVETNWRPEDEF